MEPTWERIDPPPLEETHRYELMPIGTRARIAALEAQVAGQQRVMENAIATLRKSLARRPSVAIHEVVFTLTAFLRRRSQP